MYDVVVQYIILNIKFHTFRQLYIMNFL